DNDNCDSGFLPKRLIDVGGGRLRLIERNSIRAASLANPQYCALSYCWGPPEHGKFQIKTNKDNIGDHPVGLNFEQLPQVVKDAVTTARSLSIPYLWVDALCILQDDKSDWEGQCIQMNDIYGKARVTLIPASSRTCIEGFLNPEGEGLRFPYRSVSRPHIHGSFMMYFTHAFGEVKLAYRASESTKHKHPDLFIDLHNDLHFSQWARRGWTFQEHAMAKVHIVFGTTGGDKYVSKDGKAGPVAQTSATSVQTNDELHRAWEKVAMFRYSAIKTSSFTKKEDLLPALSGLARQFGNKLQLSNELPVKYIAGHWVDRLDFTLLWEDDATTALPSLEDIVNLHGQKSYLIPTWSYLTR
ncbi:heterokaryon incompatibility protein-domain-containing protein, partial [Diaporthe sp. PMI_573]